MLSPTGENLTIYIPTLQKSHPLFSPSVLPNNGHYKLIIMPGTYNHKVPN